jgi:hypothetical protein
MKRDDTRNDPGKCGDGWQGVRYWTRSLLTRDECELTMTVRTANPLPAKAAKKTVPAVPAAEFVSPTVADESVEVGETVTDLDEAGEADESDVETSEMDKGPVDPWAALPPAVTRPVNAPAVGGRRVDVEKDTPAPIKARLNDSYAAYKAATSVEGASNADTRRAILAAWKVQEFPNVGMAEEFVKLARRYCLHGDPRLTFRGKADGASVTFLVKTFEARDAS